MKCAELDQPRKQYATVCLMMFNTFMKTVYFLCPCGKHFNDLTIPLIKLGMKRVYIAFLLFDADLESKSPTRSAFREE
jgi:hypothetical protein